LFDIGATLRQAREGRGLALEDAAQATRIRVKYLAALEDERFGALPAEVYARAFLRTYAELLGLDGEPFVAELSSRLEASRPPPPPPPPEPRFTLPRLDRRAGILLGAAGAVIFVVLVAWRGGDPQVRMPAAFNSEPAPAGETIAHRPARTKHVAQATLGPLVLAATRGDCWLSVRAGSRGGRTLYEGMLREGDEVRVGGARLWVRIGAPWNLAAERNGRALRGLPADTGNVLVTRAGVVPA
jgi:transcriptional regulator with XRE-family HTH domain